MAPLILSLLLTAEAAPLRLEALLAEVERSAPEVSVREEAVRAAEAGSRLAGGWDDPTLTVMGEELRPGAMEAGLMPMVSYRLSQPLELFGRLGLERDAATARVAVERAGLRRAAADARAQATAAFFELWMAHEMARLDEQQLALLDRMKDAALARYASGSMMGHHDVLRAKAEVARMRAELAGLAEERRAMESMLNFLRGRPAGEALGEPELPARAPLGSLDELAGRAARRPELSAMRAMRTEMEARRALAGRMYLPMVMVGGGYEQRLGEMPDSFLAEVGISLPVLSLLRRDDEVEMGEAMVARAARELDAMERMTDAELRAAWARAVAADRELAALEDAALPALEETVRSAEAAYVAGTGDFLSLLEASMTLLELRTRRATVLVRREAARAELDRVVGATGGAP